MIIAVDPGVTTGLAWYNRTTRDFDAYQTKSLDEAIGWIRDVELRSRKATFVVENYLSAGHLNKEAMYTIKLVGFFEHWIGYALGNVALVPPQKRLSGLTAARKMAEQRDIEGPHSWDALAHAVVAARSV